MDHKIGDLLLDYTTRFANLHEDQETKALNATATVEYTFGIIVDVIDIHNTNDAALLSMCRDYTDGYSYTVLWADYEYVIPHYTSPHIFSYKKELEKIEKSLDEKDNKK